jgi:hypothetical protein
MGQALLTLVAILIIYFVIKVVDKYTKEYVSVFIGTGVGCAAVIGQFIYGVIIIMILIWIVQLFG